MEGNFTTVKPIRVQKLFSYSMRASSKVNENNKSHFSQETHHILVDIRDFESCGYRTIVINNSNHFTLNKMQRWAYLILIFLVSQIKYLPNLF